MRGTLEERNMVITGSNRGTGYAVAKYFDDKGYVVHSLNKTLKGEAWMNEIQCDLSKPKKISSAVDRLKEKTETISLFENFYSKGWHWLTVHDYRATKDRAIQQLQDEFGQRDKDLIVFGDHINDIRMFKIAHQCIAVQNADERLKKYAHEVIGTNMEDSVANYLEAMFRSS